MEDSRLGLTGATPPGPNQPLAFTATGPLVRPVNASALRINATATGAGVGYVTFWSGGANGSTPPGVAQLNPMSGRTPSNGATVPVAAGMSGQALYGSESTNRMDLILDLQGYWTP